jgi:cell division protein FtsW (lipid II flippase)
MAVPLLLIAKQPDLGTAVTLIPVFSVSHSCGPAATASGYIALAACYG